MTSRLSGAGAFAALCVFATAAPALAAEPTAAELIAKNLEARGGASQLAALQSVRFEGKLVFPGGFELVYDEVRARNGGVRVNATIQGMTVIQAYDGKDAWKINPFQGRRDAERMSPDETRQMADSGLIEGPLLAANSGKAVYQGMEDVDGTPAYKVKLTQADGDEFTYFIDPDTYLEIKMVENRRIRGAEQITETELGDYEKVAGVYFPMSLSSGPRGSNSSQRQNIVVEKAEANTAAAPGYFAMPAAPAAPAAK
ncbi:MAG: hypothetical protein ACXW3D_06485 [Caulobacteraceae bacterium]